MMKKYRWSVAKSLEFLSSKKQDIDIFKSFLTQLNNFEVRLTKSNIIRSNDWLSDNSKEIEYEETIMKNTYLNGLGNKNTEPQSLNKSKELNFSILLIN